MTMGHKIAIAMATLLLIALGAYLVYAKNQGRWPFSETASVANIDAGEPRVENDVDYSKPTEDEIAEGQSAKKQLLEDSDGNNQPNSTGKKQPTPVGITYADVYNENLEVRAFANGVIESGKCHVTISKSGSDKVVRKSTEAFIDVSTTQCQPVMIPVESLATGEWSVTVEFISATHEGRSEARKVTIP